MELVTLLLCANLRITGGQQCPRGGASLPLAEVRVCPCSDYKTKSASHLVADDAHTAVDNLLQPGHVEIRDAYVPGTMPIIARSGTTLQILGYIEVFCTEGQTHLILPASWSSCGRANLPLMFAAI